MDIRDQYDRIVAGETDDADIKWSRRRLQAEALERAEKGTAEERLGALRVAAFVGLGHGLPITEKLIRDADQHVRIAAFNQAIAAKEDGRHLLRSALQGDDPALALAAADLLATAADRPSLNPALRLLGATDPAIRAAAARIVGMVGGRSALARLRVDAESDASVRSAIELARARIDGGEPRPAAAVWWSEGEVVLPSPPLHGEPLAPAHAAPTPAPAASEPQAPPASTAHDEVVDASFEELAPVAPVLEPPAAPTGLEPAVPQLPAAPLHTTSDESPSSPDAADTPWDGSATPLPATLPTEARALCRLLGMVGPPDRATVVEAVGAHDAAELGNLWIAWPPGGDEALGRGLALAAAALQRTAFLSKATAMSGDAQPRVRAAAVEAIGALGGASALMKVKGKLTDDTPVVREASVRALATMGIRLGREGMVRSWLEGLGDDADPTVTAAIGDALGSL